MITEKKQEGCSISILGDSYSTFKGYIPEGNSCYYPNSECVEDVLRVEDTWWHRLMSRNRMRLLCNESYSGATVCTQVRDGQPPESSFAVRAHYLKEFTDEKGKGPDLIILFGCTNDSWLERTGGTLQYENWTKEELDCVLPAYCYVADVLRAEHPDAKLVCVINTDLDPVIAEGMAQAGAHYGACVVRLRDIDKQNGHPSELGVAQIAEQIEAALLGAG